MTATAALLWVLTAFTGQTGETNLADRMEELRLQHDEEVRDKNAQQDWWLVSTVGRGATRHRFYIDRTRMVSMQLVSRSWIDHYERTNTGKLVHNKILMIARCDDEIPQFWFKQIINYDNDGDVVKSSTQGEKWLDVVPNSSQESLWRFTCYSEPANAIVYVPDGPRADATRAYNK